MDLGLKGLSSEVQASPQPTPSKMGASRWSSFPGVEDQVRPHHGSDAHPTLVYCTVPVLV